MHVVRPWTQVLKHTKSAILTPFSRIVTTRAHPREQDMHKKTKRAQGHEHGPSMNTSTHTEQDMHKISTNGIYVLGVAFESSKVLLCYCQTVWAKFYSTNISNKVKIRYAWCWLTVAFHINKLIMNRTYVLGVASEKLEGTVVLLPNCL